MTGGHDPGEGGGQAFEQIKADFAEISRARAMMVGAMASVSTVDASPGARRGAPASRGLVIGGACKGRTSPGRWRSWCRTSRCSWRSWSIRWRTGCGSAATRAATPTLFDDPIYLGDGGQHADLSGVGVNLKLFLALLLSGFFMRKEWWVRALLLVFILPWAVPAIPTFISIHWMLNGQWGLINNLIWNLFRIDGPPWLDRRELALGSVIVAYIWKWTPFWTVIFLAGRMAIPQELYEAAEVDGATGIRRFVHITFPLHGQPLSGLHPALDDLDARRLQYGAFRHRRRPGACRRTCWRRSASATRSSWAIRSSAWRR